MSKEKFYWLTTPYQSHIHDIKVSTENRIADIEKLSNNCVWFYNNEEKEALAFCKDLKKAIRCLYCDKYGHQDRAEWMDEAWIDKSTLD